MSRTLEFLAFLLLMMFYIILPCAVLWNRHTDLTSANALMIRYQDTWWNRKGLLAFAYLIWIVTPLSIASIGVLKFLNGEYTARALLKQVAELVYEYPLLSLAWEGVIALSSSVIFLQVMVSRMNRFHRLRVWSIEHPAGALGIMALLLLIAQALLINLGAGRIDGGIKGETFSLTR